MDERTQAQINKIRSNYDALAQAYAREVAGELNHRPLERDLLQRFVKECDGIPIPEVVPLLNVTVLDDT